MNHPSYEEDFYAWSLDQAEHLRKREFDMLDFEHLYEEIEALSGSDKSSLKNHMANALAHLLKIKYQPKYHTNSWDLSIQEARVQIKDLLEENPSFKRLLNEYLIKAYRLGILKAARETGFEVRTFPQECPWTIQEVLGE